MAEAFVGVGSNVEPERHVSMGLEHMRNRFGPLTQSTIWRSRAVGFDGNDFHNLVVAFTTPLDADALHAELSAIELACGRNRNAPRFAPRTLDLDLLLLDDAIIHSADLQLPRPEILDYAFVLQPLAEIAGDRTHPVTGKTFNEHWQQFENDEPALVAVAKG